MTSHTRLTCLVTVSCLLGALMVGCVAESGTTTEESDTRAERPRTDDDRPGDDPEDEAPDDQDTGAVDPDADPVDPGTDVAPGTDGETATDATTSDAGNSTPSDVVPDNCETLSFSLKPDALAVANFMLLVDRSNSMNTDGRWDTMVSAVRSVTTALGDRVNFGLMLFPGTAADGLFGDSCATGDVRVAAGESTATAISTALNTVPAGGTPTALSLYAARDALNASHPGGNNYVLLATDGGPGCNSSFNASTCECIPGATCGINNANCLDRERTLQAVRDLLLSGVRTFVVGIPGTAGVSDLLDQMAVAGETANAGRHYAVTDATQLVEALRTTTGSTVPCDYEFPEIPEDVDNIVVTIDGVEIPRDTTGTNGWNIARETFLQFYGTACGTLRDGNAHAVEARYDCTE